MKVEMTSRRVSVSTMVTIFWSDGLRTHFKINFSNIKYLANKFFLKAFLALSSSGKSLIGKLGAIYVMPADK